MNGVHSKLFYLSLSSPDVFKTSWLLFTGRSRRVSVVDFWEALWNPILTCIGWYRIIRYLGKNLQLWEHLTERSQWKNESSLVFKQLTEYEYQPLGRNLFSLIITLLMIYIIPFKQLQKVNAMFSLYIILFPKYFFPPLGKKNWWYITKKIPWYMTDII